MGPSMTRSRADFLTQIRPKWLGDFWREKGILFTTGADIRHFVFLANAEHTLYKKVHEFPVPKGNQMSPVILAFSSSFNNNFCHVQASSFWRFHSITQLAFY
jgi:hypothetical protein